MGHVDGGELELTIVGGVPDRFDLMSADDVRSAIRIAGDYCRLVNPHRLASADVALLDRGRVWLDDLVAGIPEWLGGGTHGWAIIEPPPQPEVLSPSAQRGLASFAEANERAGALMDEVLLAEPKDSVTAVTGDVSYLDLARHLARISNSCSVDGRWIWNETSTDSPDDRNPNLDLELVGSKVRLTTTVEDDREALLAIRMKPEVKRRWPAYDLDTEFDEDLDDDETHQLTIAPIGETAVVGLIQFGEENEPDYRHASLDIYIDPAFHGRGYASDAIRTLVEHLIEDRGHHRLTIDPAADNEAAIRCYSAVGFQPVGVMQAYERQADGSWANGLLMELVATKRRP